MANHEPWVGVVVMSSAFGDSSASGADQTLSPEAAAFVNAVGAAKNLPAFVRNVRAINSVASDERVRVALLEQAITKDVALAAKVLRIANSVSMGALGGGSVGGIGSVKQAIMLMGFERVQHLAVAASVFEQVEDDTPLVRDLLVESTLSANHSMQLALNAGYGRPELAYLCSLFHRLGELLVASHRSHQYSKWKQGAADGEPRSNSDELTHFGFTFEEVGVALAKRWGMPKAVVGTMYEYRGVSVVDEVLHTITQCSADVVRCRFDASIPDIEVAAQEIRRKFAPLIGLEVNQMSSALEAAIQESTPTLSGMGVNLDTWLEHHAATAAEVVERRLHVAATGMTPEAWRAKVAAEALHDAMAPNITDSEVEAALRETVRQLVQGMPADGNGVDLGAVIGATLQAGCTAGYARGLIAISSDDFKMVRGRLGVGVGSTDAVRIFLLRPAASFGPMGAALQERSDLFVEMTDDEAKLFRRDRVIKELKPSYFALLPLVLEDKLLGCLYFDTESDSLDFSPTSRQLLGVLRDRLVETFARHRAESGASWS